MTVATSDKPFIPPSSVEARFDRMIGWLARRGLTPEYIAELEVPGRKTGKLYRTPVNVLDIDGTEYLVAPRGETGWVRNARAAGEVTLHRRGVSETVRVAEVSLKERPEVLDVFLTRFRGAMQRYFAVRAGSGPEAMAAIAARYPVFRLTR